MNDVIYDRFLISKFADDFFDLNTVATTGKFQVVKGTGGTIALQATPGGAVNVPTAASANDYQLLATQKAAFGFVAKKPVHLECGLTLTEANTNQANVVVGLASITTTGFLLTGNGGLPTTWDGAVVYKVGGTSVWQAATSKGTNVNNNANVGAFTSGTFTRVGFEFDPNDGVTGIVTPLLNGQPLIVNTKPMSLTVPLSGIGALYLIMGVVAGSASAETLQLDYVEVTQTR